MTEAKHTPGPWHISGSVFVGDSPFPAVLDHLGLVVCDVLDDGKSEPETLANAKLIAAAPEMMEALNKIVEMNVQYAIDRYGDASKAEDMACVSVARAAIAKATGG